ncbi:MAG: PaaI family thioesterase [Acidimicrobiales bacterium]
MSMGCQLLDQLPHRSYDDGGTHVVELDITDEIRGPRGAVHGGLIACLADRAGAYAAVRSSRRPVVTSSVALSYMASAKAGPLRAVAVPLRIGGQQGVVEVHVYDDGEDNRLVATALLTMSFLPGEFPAPGPSA